MYMHSGLLMDNTCSSVPKTLQREKHKMDCYGAEDSQTVWPFPRTCVKDSYS